MPTKAEKRAAFIASIEADPKHSRDRDPERADRETATDDIGDPRNHRQTPKDERQKRIRPGVISHPEWDD